MTSGLSQMPKPAQGRAHPFDVSIIIVNWRSKGFLRSCLRSIDQDRNRSRYEVIVIDNASFDGCGEMLADEFPRAVFLESRENVGFARANNLALAHARGQHILFLNPDTEICGEAIRTLRDALTGTAGAGMVGARLLNTDRTVQTTSITALPSILNQTLNLAFLRARFPGWKIWGMRPLFRESTAPAPVHAISGACMMLPRELVERIGGFSTDYFMYAEDMDLCVKVAQAGKRLYYVPTAIIVHHGGGSSAQREETAFSSIAQRESMIHFFRKYRGRRYAFGFRMLTMIISMLRLLALAIAFPLTALAGKSGPVRLAVAKWSRILLWSCGLDRSISHPTGLPAHAEASADLSAPQSIAQ